jgi:hypothetical protein
MAFQHEKRTARHIIAGIEDAQLNTRDVFNLINEADPALVHFIFAWIRAWYPASHGASDGVLGRLVDLCVQHPKAGRLAKTGESDPIVAWFESEHRYRDFRADEFVELIIEKLEG